jgi:hypothetical protein
MEGSLLNSNLLGSSIFGRSGKVIKSIQSGTFTLDGADTTDTQAITTVDTSKAILLVNMRPNSNNSKIIEYFVRASLSANSILFVRDRDCISVYIDWQVIEFNNVKSVQRGTVSDATIPIQVTISTIDVDKSIAILNGFSCSFAAGDGEYFEEMGCGITINNSTQIEITLGMPVDRDRVFSWEVIEFK